MQKLSRQDQKNQTRLALVHTSGELFAKNGIATTTTADIAKSMKVSHGTVFLHFPTRENLIQAVTDDFGAKLNSELGKRVDVSLELRPMLKAHLAVLADFENFYVRIISENSSLPPAVRGQIFAINASLSYRLFRASQPLVKNGEIKKLDQASFFNTWMSLIHYYLMNRDLFSDELPLLKHKSSDIVRLFFNLITKDK